mgnify:FL=1
MGYILPVQQHTYKIYQYRMYEKDKNPHEVQGVRMVKFIPIQSEFDFYQQRGKVHLKEKNSRKKQHDKPVRNATASNITENEESELVGKGKHINVKV